MRRLILFVFLLGALLAAVAALWLNTPMLKAGQTADLSVEPGQSPREIAQEVVRSGVDIQPGLLYALFRCSGQARLIRAGSYEIDSTTTPYGLLRKLVRGEESLLSVTLVEGWNLRQVRDALKTAEHLTNKTQALSDAQLMQQLGRSGEFAEGRFFPDTYTYAKGSTDLALLQRAARAMDKRLQAAWTVRDARTPLRSADEALILASIIEKETGRASDRPMIAGVFTNRLRIGMRLQTDPTVIYGMGDNYTGSLRKIDLLTDTAWNTYTRAGLPPTPISMPGKAALLAAVQPAPTQALYFVARGDGSSHFSATLDEHNSAVDKYQRRMMQSAQSSQSTQPVNAGLQ